ncbi:hypothetical protein Q4603_00440 [Zobellia galactanivorans]|uniref:Uncharacterized protein n=1 Tax=Zobellia galactanivorans (strain DSM 12802 / CCUG 47099 / CIP 106680 / NCIMB 13871 / Dsij) TaxID=63186 RepID=G0L646_ZOBGA|nr:MULTISPECIES: hypothetical protein [Zobellia]MBU3027668.1 hypothetical protein [Zobellia galactanivorans]MDO6807049.1 hypothetical protein [Zobellia galactanivorans]CAZ96708.1 Putative protein [Zobellia galactanivorans]
MNNRLKSLLYLASFVTAVIVYDRYNKDHEDNSNHVVADVVIEQISAPERLN